ncbi:MAG: hypothetical protein A3G34_07640 [Candidatus Lindowbacteria bacterium RIFCSPLOWO2_12_FULL_62_27]|nr:MAG: hypothetical protein A3G34_07640 [Candidatus Lindowbacteria bacterium RIFCSPLOWO2_12_FULL_62_27]OGH63555.1 MAG: hypothetical protein A3I06_06880 [Candidatus Lindowbacteria bacterium RIFCSPLOWO2_02_FULL_62_12]
MNAVRLWACFAIALFGACAPASDTQRLSPVIAPGGPVELVDARGYPIAVSRLQASDVAIFAIAHGKYIILWVRCENFSNEAVVLSPALITAEAVGKKNRRKNMKLFLPGSKGSEFKTLHRDLAGVYQLLSGAAAQGESKLAGLKEEWKEHGGDYQSIEHILLGASTLGVHHAAEGYVILQRVPAEKYVLTLPLAGDLHRFELIP